MIKNKKDKEVFSSHASICTRFSCTYSLAQELNSLSNSLSSRSCLSSHLNNNNIDDPLLTESHKQIHNKPKIPNPS